MKLTNVLYFNNFILKAKKIKILFYSFFMVYLRVKFQNDKRKNLKKEIRIK